MDRHAACERLSNIVSLWCNAMASYPPEIAAAQVSMVVMRGPDIEAIEMALRALEGEVAYVPNN